MDPARPQPAAGAGNPDPVRYLRVATLEDAKVHAIVLRGLPRIAAAPAAGNGEAVGKVMLEHLGEAKKSLRRAVGLNGQ